MIDYRELLKKYMGLVWDDDFIVAERCAGLGGWKGWTMGEYSKEERAEMAALLAEIRATLAVRK